MAPQKICKNQEAEMAKKRASNQNEQFTQLSPCLFVLQVFPEAYS